MAPWISFPNSWCHPLDLQKHVNPMSRTQCPTKVVAQKHAGLRGGEDAPKKHQHEGGAKESHGEPQREEGISW